MIQKEGIKTWINNNKKALDILYGRFCMMMPFYLLASVILVYLAGEAPSKTHLASTLQNYSTASNKSGLTTPNRDITFINEFTNDIYAFDADDSEAGVITLPKGRYIMQTKTRYRINNRDHVLVTTQNYEVR